jgi:glucose-1-phosphate thymidylyltransferase
MIKAVILAAGEGRRLRPLTVTRPKVMIPIANRPILEYIIDALISNGIRDIILVVGYKREQIMSYFEDGKAFGAKLTYVVQKKQLGTAHALYQARSYIKSDNEFIVLPGDNIIGAASIAELIKLRKNAVLLTREAYPTKFGVARTKGRRLMALAEKVTAESTSEVGVNLIGTGIFLFSPAILDTLWTRVEAGSTDLTTMVQRLIEDGIEFSYTETDIWSEAVYPWNLLYQNAMALSTIALEKHGKLERGVMLKGPVAVGKGSIIRAGSYIEGPVVIGNGCEIGPSACILPATSIGHNVTIGSFTELAHSIIMNDVNIGACSVISNSVISEGCTLGPHFVAVHGDTYVRVHDGFHEVKKIGAIIGEDCNFGSSTVVKPGIIIGAHCKVNPQITIRENVPDNSILG